MRAHLCAYVCAPFVCVAALSHMHRLVSRPVRNMCDASGFFLCACVFRGSSLKTLVCFCLHRRCWSCCRWCRCVACCVCSMRCVACWVVVVCAACVCVCLHAGCLCVTVFWIHWCPTSATRCWLSECSSLSLSLCVCVWWRVFLQLHLRQLCLYLLFHCGCPTELLVTLFLC